MIRTFHTYGDLLIDGGRLAETTWRCASAAAAVAATLRGDAEAVILRVRTDKETLRGLAPGGLAA